MKDSSQIARSFFARTAHWAEPQQQQHSGQSEVGSRRWAVGGGQLEVGSWRRAVGRKDVKKCSVRLKRLECIHFNCKGGIICIGEETKNMRLQKLSTQRLQKPIHLIC